MAGTAQNIGFMLTEQFSMIAFTAAIEPLRLANRVTGKTLYQWQLHSADGVTAEASNGVQVKVDRAFKDASAMDAVVVCSGVEVKRIDHRALITVLRRLTRSGAAAGAVCTGAYVLAKAGLLEGYRSTIHWENRPGMQVDFPDLEIGEDLFEIDRDRFTCAGGVAAADMMLSLIKRDHGDPVSKAITDQLIHHRIRDAGERQRIDLRTRLGVSHPKLLRVVSLMEQTIDHPLTMSQFAKSVGLSNRQLERLFWKHLGHPPSRHYLKLRLDHACQLLRHTAIPVLEVAVACGFNSASYFSQSYTEFFGHSPSVERKGAAVAA
ncbi:GlxA family transcriptional regulator [Devosia beringensis]|uniref:GlxA family transcriptional regulator n=1 Tax=Devosia beringensis TaxID=2657486 RepID=UPI001E60AB05|nr:GlxA family transcriptional regulator [Devosia beringensis]